MTEEVKFKISGEIDATALDQFRKKLNESRNDLNALARESEKGSTSWKNYKASVAEVNNILKLSDDQLKHYIGTVIQEEQALNKGSVATDKHEIATGKLGKSLKTTTKAFTSIFGASVSLIGTLGTLTPLVSEQGGAFDEVTQKVSTYGTALIGIGSTIANLKYVFPSLSLSVLASVGSFAAAAAAVGALSAAFAVVKETIANMNISEGVGNLILLKQKLSEIGSGKETNENKITINGKEYFKSDVEEQLLKGPNQYSDTIGPQIPAVEDAERLLRINEEKNKVSTGSVTKVKEEKVELNEIQLLQKQISELELKKLEYITSYGEQSNIVLDTLKQIADLNSQIVRLTGTKVIYDTSGVVVPERKTPLFSSEDIRQSGFNAEAEAIDNIKGKDTFGEKASKTLDDTDKIFSTVSSAMNLLGVSADSFVGKIVGGFGEVLEIMQLIKTVNSIFNFIPGLAGGGIASGAFIAGERGAELITPMGNGMNRVYNNSDTVRMLNQTVNSHASPVNVFVTTDMSDEYFSAKISKYNSNKRYIRG